MPAPDNPNAIAVSPPVELPKGYQPPIDLGAISILTPTSQEYILVGKDRATIVFHEWTERIRSKTAWHTPLGCVISLAAALGTTSFKDFNWVTGATLRGVFLTATLGCAVWLVREVYRASKSSGSAQDFIVRLSEGTRKTAYPSPNETDSNSGAS